MAAFGFGNTVPITLEGGVFNGSGLTKQKDFWTSNYNFAFKAQSKILDCIHVVLSMMKANAGTVNTYLYDAGAYYKDVKWHVEAEYLRKHYAGDAFRPVNVLDAFAVYRIPLKNGLTALSLLGRYDYMSDHSKGTLSEDGLLSLDDPERHRITGGVTLSLGKKSLQADVRVNYEQYFYPEAANPLISERSKAVVEFVVHF